MAHRPKDDHLRLREATSLDKEIARFVHQHIPEAVKSGRGLRRTWEAIVSPQILEHTDNVIYCKRSKERVILVYVDDSSWAAELNMQKEYFRILMEERLAQPIAELNFLVSRLTALRKREAKKWHGNSS